MENKSLYRISGYAGILSAILFIISIIGLQFYIAVELEDVASFTQNMNDNTLMMMLYGWPGIIATILIIPLVYVFHKMNNSNKQLSSVVFIITLIGLSFVIIAYLFHLALTYFYAPMFHTLDPAQQASFGPFFKATIGLQDMFWLNGDLLSFGGIAVLLWLTMKEKKFPKWFLYVGIVSGTLAALGSFGFIPILKPHFWISGTFILGFIIFAIWEILAGIRLIKLSKQIE